MFATLTYSTPNSPLQFRLGNPRNSSAVRIRASAQVASPPDTRRRQIDSLYDVLQLDCNASQAQIKSAYRRLAKIYHPDSIDSDSDGNDFIKIHNAYATLSDPSAKSMYDLVLSRESERRFGRCNSGFYSTRRWETDQCW